eukprot:m.92931 g.92931  ORF g.92931 m.92931 type:complete len:3767 (+) comp36766_c0_seq1:23-11323(+)
MATNEQTKAISSPGKSQRQSLPKIKKHKSGPVARPLLTAANIMRNLNAVVKESSSRKDWENLLFSLRGTTWTSMEQTKEITEVVKRVWFLLTQSPAGLDSFIRIPIQQALKSIFPEIISQCEGSGLSLQVSDITHALPHVLHDIVMEARFWTTNWKSRLSSSPDFQLSALPQRLPPIPPSPDVLIPASATHKTRRLAKSVSKVITGRELVENLIQNKVESEFDMAYLKERDHPYDLIVVDKHQIRNVYQVISKLGVLYVTSQGIEDNLTLSEWYHHSLLFDILKKYTFFRLFSVAKAFNRWKANLKFIKFQRLFSSIKKELIPGYPLYGNALLAVQDVLVHLDMPDVLMSPTHQLYCFSVTEFEELVEQWSIGIKESLIHLFPLIQDVLVATGNRVYQHVDELELIKRNPPLTTSLPISVEKERRIELEESLKRAGDCFLRLAAFTQCVRQLVESHLIGTVQTHLAAYLKRVSMCRDGAPPLIEVQLIFSHSDEIVTHPSSHDITQLILMPITMLVKAVNETADHYDVTDLQSGSSIGTSNVVDTPYPGVMRTDAGKLMVKGRHVIGHVPPLYSTLRENILYNDKVSGRLAQLKGTVEEGLAEMMEFGSSYTWLADLHGFIKSYTPELLSLYLNQSKDHLKEFFDMLNSWQKNLLFLPLSVQAKSGLLQANCQPVQGTVKHKLDAIIQVFHQAIVDQWLQMKQDFNAKLEQLTKSTEVTEHPVIGDFIEYARHVQIAKEQRRALQAILEKIEDQCALIDHYGLFENPTNEEVGGAWEKFLFGIQKSTDHVLEQTPVNTEALHSKLKELDKKCDELRRKLESRRFRTPTKLVVPIMEELVGLGRGCSETKAEIDSLSQWLVILTGNPWNSEKGEALVLSFSHQEFLWKCYQEMRFCLKQWKMTPFSKINMHHVMSKVSDWLGPVRDNLSAKFAPDNEIFEDWYQTLVEIQELLIPLEKISVSHLQSGHWTALCVGLGLGTEEQESLTVGEMLQCDLLKHSPLIDNICLEAATLHALQLSLRQVTAAWEHKEFHLAKHIGVFAEKKELNDFLSDAYLLSDIDEMKAALEDDIISLQLIVSSPAASTDLRIHAQTWLTMLQDLASLLDLWENAQNKWLYLRSLIEKGTAWNSLAHLQQRFPEVDSQFHSIVQHFVENPKVMSVIDQMTSKASGSTSFSRLYRLLTSCLANEESLLVHVDNHIEYVCEQFPRLYFISKDSIIQLSATSHNPKLIIPFVSLVYPSIKSVNVKEKAAADAVTGQGQVLQIVSIVGDADETVPLCQVVTTDKEPQFCLRELGSVARQTLALVLRECFVKYPRNLSGETALSDWIMAFPCQCLLGVAAIYFTGLIKSAVKFNQIRNYCSQLVNACYRLLHGQPSLSFRRNLHLNNLILQSIHHRDITQGLESRSSHCFFHHSLDLDGSYKIQLADDVFHYGYEYVSPASPLLITPLTERVLHCLAKAVAFHQCGCIHGHEGTGKSALIQHMANAFGRYYVTVSCSSFVNPSLLIRYFSGASLCGSWLAFVDCHMLSNSLFHLLSQFVFQLSFAMKSTYTLNGNNHCGLRRRALCSSMPLLHETQLEEEFGVAVSEVLPFTDDMNCSDSRSIVFQSKLISCSSSYACFLATSQSINKLPDYLLASVRCVTSSTPSLHQICEVYLWLAGFQDSFALSNKLSRFLSQISYLNASSVLQHARLIASTARQLRDRGEELTDLDVLQKASILYLEPIIASEDGTAVGKIAVEIFGSSEDWGRESLNRQLTDEIKEQFARSKLTPTDAATARISQLYHSIESNGVTLLCGAPGSGKTTCYTILHQMLSRLYADYSQSAMMGESKESVLSEGLKRVEVSTIFPASLSPAELFGGLLVDSNQWRDGLLARLLRRLLSSSSSVQTKRWIVLDGSLPTDLAETLIPAFFKRQPLCLSSGERLSIADSVYVLVEETDISQYSPACLSHAGLVHFGTVAVHWKAVFQSWIDSCYSKWDAHLVRLLSSQCEQIIEPTLDFLEKCGSPSNALQTVTSLANFLSSLLEKNHQVLRGCRFLLTNEHIIRLISSLFGLAYIWAFGSRLDEKDRMAFDNFARSQLSLCPIPVSLPDIGTVFDYWIEVVDGKCRFVQWQGRSVAKSALLSIPEVTRYVTLVDLLVSSGFNVMLEGSAGIGKTSLIQLASAHHSHSHANFFPAITGQQLRALLTERLHAIQKRQQVSIGGGPRRRRRHHVIFVDDLNAVSASDTAFEVLRQAVSHSTVVDVYSLVPESLAGIQFVGACRPRGSPGSTDRMSERLCRHFTVLSIPSHANKTLKSLLVPGTVRWLTSFGHLSGTTLLAETLVGMSIRLHKSIQSLFVVSPANPHYLFSYHHLMRLHQSLEILGGLLRGRGHDGVDASPSRRRSLYDSKKTPKGRRGVGETTVQTVVRFYCHEVMRCYGDSLVSSSDTMNIQKKLRQILTDGLCGNTTGSGPGRFARRPSAAEESIATTDHSHKYLDMREVIGISQDLQQLVFTQHLLPVELTGYRECTLPQLIEGGSDVLKSIDDELSGSVLMFREAAEHCARLCRVLMLPQGHAILIGSAISGKGTVVKLACHAVHRKLIEAGSSSMADLVGCLKNACQLAGVKGEECVLFVRAKHFPRCPQLLFLLMKQGMATSLFSLDEVQTICSEMVSSRGRLKSIIATRKEQPDVSVERFWQNVKKKLHIFISMTSPDDVHKWIGNDPGLLTLAAAVDCHKAWPRDALTEVAYGCFRRSADNKIPWNDKGGQELSIAEFMAFIHLKACASARDKWKRDMFTPYTYLEFIELFVSFGLEIREKHENELSVVEAGLHKIKETVAIVEQFETELFHLNRSREEYLNECQETANEADAMKECLETLQQKYRNEDEIQNQEKASIDQLKREAQFQYDEATPLYEAALAALNSLGKQDVDELRTYVRPPTDFQEVSRAVCLLFGLPQSWDEAKMLFHTEDFFENLQFFDKENVTRQTLKELRAFTSSKSFAETRISCVSRAAASLAMWVKAVETFATIHRIVEPKRKKLAKAENRLKQMQHHLIDIQKEMMAAQREWQIAARKNAKATKALAEIDETIRGVEVKKKKAKDVLKTLHEEELKWMDQQKYHHQELNFCPGNATITAAFVTYLGCLSAGEQREQLKLWVDFAKSHTAMSVTFPFHLHHYLTSDRELDAWKPSLLPQDEFTTNTAAALKYDLWYGSKRWPLVIDPQNQAESWLQTVTNESGFVAIKADRKDLMAVLLEAQLHKKSVLVTHVETMDSFCEIERILARSRITEKGFRLCLATTLTKKQLSSFNFPLEDVCIFDLSLSGDGLEKWFLHRAAQIDWPEYVGHVRSVYRDLALHSDNQRTYQRLALDVVASLEGDLLSNDGPAKNAVEESQEQGLAAKVQLQLADQLLCELKEKVEEYRPLARLMKCLTKTMERLESVVPLYRLSFDYVTDVFQRAVSVNVKLKAVGSDPKARCQDVAGQVTKEVVHSVSRSYLRGHAVILSLLLLLEEKEIKGELVDILIRDGELVQEQSGKPDWLSERKWSAVKNFEKYGKLRGLGDDLCNDGEYWKEYFQLDPVLLNPEPALKSVKLEEIHMLILWKIIAPEKFSAACVRFIINRLGPQFVRQASTTLREVIGITKATKVAMIIHEGTDTTKTVQQLIMAAKNDPDCIGIHELFLAHETNVGSIVTRLKKSLECAHWVVVNVTYWKGKWPDRLVKAVKELIAESQMHPHFRLWVLGNDSSSLPMTLQDQVSKISATVVDCFQFEDDPEMTKIPTEVLIKALSYQ